MLKVLSDKLRGGPGASISRGGPKFSGGSKILAEGGEVEGEAMNPNDAMTILAGNRDPKNLQAKIGML